MFQRAFLNQSTHTETIVNMRTLRDLEIVATRRKGQGMILLFSSCFVAKELGRLLPAPLSHALQNGGGNTIVLKTILAVILSNQKLYLPVYVDS